MSLTVRKQAIVLAVAIALCGCTGFEYRYEESQARQLTQEILGETAGESVQLPPILQLDPAFEALLDERINNSWNDGFKLRRLRELLYDEDQLGITYNATYTRTAMEVIEERAGNCLSMTSLFIAAARHVGLDAHYETVEVEPTWDQAGKTMVRYEHIVAAGRLPGAGEYVVDFLPEFIIGDKASRRISDREAAKLYYSNLGAEALLRGEMTHAMSNLLRALRLDPTFSDGWNNLGIAFRRQEDVRLAEFAFQQALLLDAHNYPALSNLAQLYKEQGRNQEADALMDRVNAYRRRNPQFHHYVARLLIEEREYVQSIELLKRAIRLKRDEPRFYETLAEAYGMVGDIRERKRALALAEKYRLAENRIPQRQHDHRFFIQRVDGTRF